MSHLRWWSGAKYLSAGKCSRRRSLKMIATRPWSASLRGSSLRMAVRPRISPRPPRRARSSCPTPESRCFPSTAERAPKRSIAPSGRRGRPTRTSWRPRRSWSAGPFSTAPTTGRAIGPAARSSFCLAPGTRSRRRARGSSWISSSTPSSRLWPARASWSQSPGAWRTCQAASTRGPLPRRPSRPCPRRGASSGWARRVS
mmetsp:Transcript_20335/g.45968  ORF Transcript_20335/g.45968 Transcript_20335/m.45968 type:complete len:200 (+) Transcript_20335:203-802(+)